MPPAPPRCKRNRTFVAWRGRDPRDCFTRDPDARALLLCYVDHSRFPRNRWAGATADRGRPISAHRSCSVLWKCGRRFVQIRDSKYGRARKFAATPKPALLSRVSADDLLGATGVRRAIGSTMCWRVQMRTRCSAGGIVWPGRSRRAVLAI